MKVLKTSVIQMIPRKAKMATATLHFHKQLSKCLAHTNNWFDYLLQNIWTFRQLQLPSPDHLHPLSNQGVQLLLHLLLPLPEIMGSCQALKYWVATEDVTQGWVEFLVVTRAWNWDKLLSHIRALFPHRLLIVASGIRGSFNHSGWNIYKRVSCFTCNAQVGWGPRIECFW